MSVNLMNQFDNSSENLFKVYIQFLISSETVFFLLLRSIGHISYLITCKMTWLY